MPLKFRKMVVLAKIETTYGTDSTPTGAANAIQCSNVEFTPLEADEESRDLVRNNLGAQQVIHIGLRAMISFEVEVAGAGAAGTAPAYGPLLRACAMSETISAGVSVIYNPVDSSEEAVTLWFFIDGQKHAMVGVRGDWGFVLDAKKIPKYKFNFTGIFVDPSTVANPTPTYTAFQLPKAITNANTPTFTLHSLAAKLQKLEVSSGVKTSYRNLVGVEEVSVVDRDGGGNCLIEAPVLTTKNFFTIAKAETLAAMQLVHGTAAGGIVQFDASKVQINKPRYSNQDGIAMLQMDLIFVPTSGNDEYSLTVK